MKWAFNLFWWKKQVKPIDLSANRLTSEQIEAARAPIREKILDLRDSLSMEEEVYSKGPEYAEQLKHAKFGRIPH